MNEEYYIKLIYKKIEDNLSLSEHQELEEWLNASEDNRLSMQTILAIWEASAKNSISDDQIDVDKDFEALENRINNESQLIIKPSKKVFFLGRNLLVAASLALLITVGGLLWNNSVNVSDIEWVEVVATEETKSLILPDGSTIGLNKNTKLSYPKTFPKNERLVAISGEAFFSIAHDPKRPFHVDTETAKISVLGTKFNVKTDAESGIISVYVQSGKVRFSPKKQIQNVDLEVRDLGEWDPTLTKITKYSNVSTNEVSWYTGSLAFKDERMDKVINTLEEHYKVAISVTNEELFNCNMTVVMDQLSSDQAMDILTTVLSANWEKSNGNQYRILGGSCN